jgi:hypothetical protein
VFLGGEGRAAAVGGAARAGRASEARRRGGPAATSQPLTPPPRCAAPRHHPSTLHARRGPSGSGKTSLLSVISGRAPRAVRTSGRVTVNGAKFSKQAKRRVGFVLQVRGGGEGGGGSAEQGHLHPLCACGQGAHAARGKRAACGPQPAATRPLDTASRQPPPKPHTRPPNPPQDDLLYETLTVEETLGYAAALRLPRGMSAAERRGRVDDVITALGLGKCRGTIIGGYFRRGISGGERKRVSIGAHRARGTPGSGRAGLGARRARGAPGSGRAGLGARRARGAPGSGRAGLGARPPPP